MISKPAEHNFLKDESLKRKIHVSTHSPQFDLLVYLSAVLDENECKLDLLQWTSAAKEIYFGKIYVTIAREDHELGGTDKFTV